MTHSAFGTGHAPTSGTSHFDTRTGFAAGIGLDLGFGIFRLSPELLYVQKGVNGDGSPSSTAVKLDYAEIPVLLKVSLPIPSVQPFVYAGPSIALRLSCKTDEVDCSSDTIKDRDYGAVLGAGIKLGGKLSVEGRYNWGLSDLNRILLVVHGGGRRCRNQLQGRPQRFGSKSMRA